MKRLVEKKGVDVAQIGRKIDGNIKNSGNYDEFHQYLLNQSLTKKDIRRIEAAKTLHDARWLDVNDVKYQEISSGEGKIPTDEECGICCCF